jgi:hypothetical protein
VPDVITNLIQDAPLAALFRPLSLTDTAAGVIPGSISVLVRDEGVDAAVRLGQLAAGVRGDGPPPVVVNVREAIDASLVQPRYIMRVLAAFALLGVVLAAVGLFGVISYSVGQRTREIGVRMALGAQPRQVRVMVLRESGAMAIVGVAAGIGTSIALARLVRSMLFGLTPADPATLAGAACLLFAMAVLAAYGPARRASRINPIQALRHE